MRQTFRTLCAPEEGGGTGKRGSPVLGHPREHSLPGIVDDLARICEELAALVGKMPCVARAKPEIHVSEGEG